MVSSSESSAQSNNYFERVAHDRRFVSIVWQANNEKGMIVSNHPSSEHQIYHYTVSLTWNDFQLDPTRLHISV